MPDPNDDPIEAFSPLEQLCFEVLTELQDEWSLIDEARRLAALLQDRFEVAVIDPEGDGPATGVAEAVFYHARFSGQPDAWGAPPVLPLRFRRDFPIEYLPSFAKQVLKAIEAGQSLPSAPIYRSAPFSWDTKTEKPEEKTPIGPETVTTFEIDGTPHYMPGKQHCRCVIHTHHACPRCSGTLHFQGVYGGIVRQCEDCGHTE